MADWSVEAFREDTQEFAWQVELAGVEREELERELRISLPTPDSYRITVEQVATAVRASSSGVSPSGLDLSADRFSYFLTATER